MAFTLWSLFEATLLCLNAVCVLHEERFLSKIGWGANQIQGFGEQPTAKSQILNLIRSIRTVMRIWRCSMLLYCWVLEVCYLLPIHQVVMHQILFIPVPLIFLNIVTIVVKLILG